MYIYIIYIYIYIYIYAEHEIDTLQVVMHSKFKFERKKCELLFEKVLHAQVFAYNMIQESEMCISVQYFIDLEFSQK